MQFSILQAIVLALAAQVTAFAVPNEARQLGGVAGANPLPTVPTGMTIGSAMDACGHATQLSCCNQADTSGDASSTAGGILSDLIPSLLSGTDGLGLFDGCSKLSVTRLITVDTLLNSQCKQDVAACCRGPLSTGRGGLDSIGLPCVAIGGLV